MNNKKNILIYSLTFVAAICIALLLKDKRPNKGEKVPVDRMSYYQLDSAIMLILTDSNSLSRSYLDSLYAKVNLSSSQKTIPKKVINGRKK